MTRPPAARSVAVVALGAATSVVLLGWPAEAMPLDTSAEVPEPGGVAVSVIGREQVSGSTRDASAAPVDGPTPLLHTAPTAAPIPVLTANESFAPETNDFNPAPCLRRRVGGSWGDSLSFCAAEDAADRTRRPSPEDVARVLADRARALAPTPRIDIAPERVGLTGLESYFWVAPPAPVRAAASVAGTTVVAEARAVQYVWSFGDGSGLVTDHPGVAWPSRDARSAAITHTYETDGRHAVTVEQIWEARWRAGAGGWQPLGFFSETQTRVYPVRAIVALLVPAP